MNCKISAVLLVAALLTGTLTACTGAGIQSSSVVSRQSASSAGTASAAQVSPAPSSRQSAVRISIGPEPESLDPALSSTEDTDAYCAAAFEGLYKVNAAGKTVLGQAQKAVVSADKKVWTFTLRSDARWSDGTAVKAQDFVYAWRRNIQLADAQQKELFAYLKNGEEILSGSNTDVSSLGAEALDDQTLRVTLASPCELLPQMLMRPVFMPLRSDIVASHNSWDHSPDTFICNGPMKMTQWNVKTNIIYARSSTYYDVSQVNVSILTCMLSEDDETRLSSYDNNETSYISSLPVKYYTRIRERGDMSTSAAGTECLQFNTKVDALSDAQVRKALSLAIDRDTLAVATTGMHFTPAAAFVPTGFVDAGGKNDFRTVGGSCYKVSADDYSANVTSARTLLEQAGYAGGKNFPQLTITVPIFSLDSAAANAIAQMWKTQLGISCTVSVQPRKTYQQNCRKGNVQMTISRVTPAYEDPSAYLENFVSDGFGSMTGWKDNTFQAQMTSARRSAAGSTQRYSALHAAEKRLAEEAPAVALFYMPSLSLRDSRLNGIFTTQSGVTYFVYARLFTD
ncbi:peptide ABC transporter substrate-binding protein [Caproicibacterium lactatifermentans]|jgi:oligopeptide transport system substrate-binding protein|uniref:peptide ABC transporter substrate-binding protein n=1 Tax=Caproicibacterium lactatifermentans TaxID=2666138 RepID=UPI003D8B6361